MGASENKVDRGEPATPLARWLDAIGLGGRVRSDFDGLLARYRSEVGPVSPEAFRVWLWRDARIAVVPGSGHLCLPDEWPSLAEASVTRH